MRKVGIMCFLLVSIVFITNGCSIKFREIGTEKYYVKIDGGGIKKESLDNNTKIVDYYYEYKNVPAYNSNGEKILVNINTLVDKELKKDAYLKVSVRNPSTENTNDIQGFEEVDISKIPEKAKNKF
ncbi:YxeA family protein [Clostridium sardiniense]|uniref:YxeA family protein n=1 Tax=Clostridium sardiniense TaxID=29369 RepID=UPI00195A0AC2|nr:YxeA family protein [Clostridium sardiniense]MBM7835570.1 uncharacterized protein YxeA [Clostridium sardiniense]